MALTALPRMTSQTPDLTRAVDLVKKAVDPLLGQPYLDGVVLTGVSVTAATSFTVTHNLGRVPVGAVVVSATSSAMMVVRLASTLPTSTQLTLLPSATGTLSLRVF